MTKVSSDALGDLGLRPLLGHDLPTLFSWLQQNGMTAPSSSFDLAFGPVSKEQRPDTVAAIACAHSTRRNSHASQRHTQAQLSELIKRHRSASLGIDREALWGAVRDARGSVRTLDWRRLPAEAMAFYRPFHFLPFDQFGIYLLVRPLLDYLRVLERSRGVVGLFSRETLMHLVLFEVFHHEFFHHMVESTATALELLLAAQGQPRSIYVSYGDNLVAHAFDHPHDPLEEALANAYAHNSLGFITRIKAGVKTASIRAYQHAIAHHWDSEPPGYSAAAFYVGGNYVDGATLLVTQLLAKERSKADTVPLSVIAKHVMPNGVTALLAKPDIPTWLVGSDSDLDELQKLVPAPNEAYTQLFWPYNTDAIDRYIADQQARLKAEKERRKTAMALPPQQFDLFGSPGSPLAQARS